MKYYIKQLNTLLCNLSLVAVLQRAGESIGPRPNHGKRVDSAIIEDHGDQGGSQDTTGWNSHDREATGLGEGAGGVDQKCVYSLITLIVST